MTNLNEELEPLSISALSFALKGLVERQFGSVYVRGEVSGLKHHTSGHLYFSLKDDQSVLESVCWRGSLSRLDLIPQDGMEVLCKGKLTTYPGRSKYQMVVESLSLSGEGTLLKLLEERRRRLGAEGLFDEARKKNLPLLPRCIGIITSPTGAVIQDILHRLADRCPRNVLLWPVTVQGDKAAPQIIEAIEGFNSPNFPLMRPDVLIVARGGGSLEDLWAFNDEDLVRCVAASHIPLISGVGHEPDVTLIDYVADWRAPTPTAAAERAVPVRDELLSALDAQRLRAARALTRHTHETQQRLDERTDRLMRTGPVLLEKWTQNLGHLGQRLRHPQDVIAQKQLLLDTLWARSNQAAQQHLTLSSSHFHNLQNLLKSYSYTQTLGRGFTLIQSQEGVYLKKVNDAKPGMAINITFQDGTRAAQMTGAPKKRLQPTPSTPCAQTTLF